MPLEKSVLSPSTSSFNIGNPNSGTLTPTVIEPQYRSSDDNACDLDNGTTITDLDSAHERHNNTSLSAHDTLAQDTSTVNTSMEVLIGDSVLTTSDLRDCSQDVTSNHSTCEHILQDVVYTSSTPLNPPDSSQELTSNQALGEPLSVTLLLNNPDTSQEVTNKQNLPKSAGSQDITVLQDETSRLLRDMSPPR